MRTTLRALLIVLSAAASAAVMAQDEAVMISAQLPVQKVEVFPATDTITGRPPIGEFQREWYSKHLVAMGEPILLEGPGETYRFLWLRSFHHPVSVRVVCIDKACQLTGLRTDGHGGYAPGSVVERKTRRLSDTEAVRFREMLARVQFWRPQPVDDRIGLDGAQWILEGRRGQTYHLWDVWAPCNSFASQVWLSVRTTFTEDSSGSTTLGRIDFLLCSTCPTRLSAASAVERWGASTG